jgi:hypothetical protein
LRGACALQFEWREADNASGAIRAASMLSFVSNVIASQRVARMSRSMTGTAKQSRARSREDDFRIASKLTLLAMTATKRANGCLTIKSGIDAGLVWETMLWEAMIWEASEMVPWRPIALLAGNKTELLKQGFLSSTFGAADQGRAFKPVL